MQLAAFTLNWLVVPYPWSLAAIVLWLCAWDGALPVRASAILLTWASAPNWCPMVLAKLRDAILNDASAALVGFCTRTR